MTDFLSPKTDFPSERFEFQIEKTNFSNANWVSVAIPDLQENQILFQVRKFALSANNITYLHLGESFGYWKFFPTQLGFGIMPVWGFGDVIASKHADVKVGSSFYGYYPLSTALVVEANKVREIGFTDMASHRTKLPSIYNFYSHLVNDPLYTSDTENLQLTFRPLFTTSFLLEDFLFEKNFFDSEQILITSASSKTAIALAHLLDSRRKKDGLQFQIVGMSSGKNLEFLKSLGYFDSVFSYDSIAGVLQLKTCVTDFSGNQNLLLDLKKHLQKNLSYLSLVGMTSQQEIGGEKSEASLGEVFFAPNQSRKRTREWGFDLFQEKLIGKYFDFLEKTKSWMEFQEITDRKDFQEAYLDLLEGRLSPKVGIVVNSSYYET